MSMTVTMTRTPASLVLVLFLTLGSATAEYLSDISISPLDESRARGIKKEQFWSAMLDRAEDSLALARLSFCDEADALISQLPKENEFVQSKLGEAVEHLRRANKQLIAQSQGTREVAEQKTAEASAGGWSWGWSKSWNWNDGLSFKNFWKHAAAELQEGGAYAQALGRDVADRQAEALPVLRGAADRLGGVLQACRQTSRLSFDVLKYDIYHRGVPKTPAAAKDVADKLIAAQRETRSEFLALSVAPVQSLVRDDQGKSVGAAATVVQAELEGVGSKRFGFGASANFEFNSNSDVGISDAQSQAVEQIFNI